MERTKRGCGRTRNSGAYIFCPPMIFRHIIFKMLRHLLSEKKANFDIFEILEWPNPLRGSPYPEPKKRYFFLIFFKLKIKTQVNDFPHIFRYISDLVKIVILFENDKKSRTNRRSRAASLHGQLKSHV